MMGGMGTPLSLLHINIVAYSVHPLQYDTSSGVCNAYGNIKTANIQPNPVSHHFLIVINFM